jgi:RNA polymerase sigma-70 factor (ECF subfamily)
MVGDGGGRGAVRTPVEGSLRVARFLAGLGRLGAKQGVEMAITWVNGQPGAVVYVPSGPVMGTMNLDIVDGKVAAIHSVVNPDKLKRVAPPR